MMKESNYTTYMKGDLRSDVIKLDGHWGCRFYHGKSESYAESAAENYVEGIKKL